MANAVQVESIQPPLLPGICSLSFTVIHQGPDGTGIIHCYICRRSQLSVCADAVCEMDMFVAEFPIFLLTSLSWEKFLVIMGRVR